MLISIKYIDYIKQNFLFYEIWILSLMSIFMIRTSFVKSNITSINMKKRKILLTAISLSASVGLIVSMFFGLTSCNKQQGSDITSNTVSFDENWRFVKDSISGAESPDFNDSNWRILDVPHDWSIEDLPGQNGVDIIGPFDKSAVDRMSSGYLVGGPVGTEKVLQLRKRIRIKLPI